MDKKTKLSKLQIFQSNSLRACLLVIMIMLSSNNFLQYFMSGETLVLYNCIFYLGPSQQLSERKGRP